MLLSEIIDHAYQEYQPRLTKKGGSLDLDLKNPRIPVENSSLVAKSLDNYLYFALKKVRSAQIVLKSVSEKGENYLILEDKSTILDKSEKKPFENKITSVKSRVGFGTTLKFKL